MGGDLFFVFFFLLRLIVLFVFSLSVFFLGGFFKMRLLLYYLNLRRFTAAAKTIRPLIYIISVEGSGTAEISASTK